MSSEHHRPFLSSLRYFQGFEPREIGVLLGVLQERRLVDGEVLFSEGEPGDACYLVASGEMRVVIGDGPGAKELARLKAGVLFGQVALLDGERRSASCVASGDAVVLALLRNDFDLLVESRSSFAYKFLTVITHLVASQLRYADGRLLRLAAEQQRAKEPAAPDAPEVARVFEDVAARADSSQGASFDPQALQGIYKRKRT